ncbi:MAG: hypothetical protein C7B44_09735 [Sulfobacillus thermosulfidooxidans]|nr:MAG: hypothetical protein C7B44_09735 [Sulfobacillus thermosulfidooxidans]
MPRIKNNKPLVVGAMVSIACCGLMATSLISSHPVDASPGPSGYFTDTAWRSYSEFPGHNAVVALSKTAPTPLRTGVQWQTPEFDAVPLSRQPLGTQAFGGMVNAAVTMTQNLGNGVGVSAWGRDIYAASSAGYIYAVNALTGHMQWKFRTLNVDMSNPLVAHDTVYAGTGNVAFNFPALMTFAAGQPTVRGGGYGGVYALNAQTGQLRWFHPLSGEQMPTPALYRGTLYFANGNGYFYALSAATGKTQWKLLLGGFDSMSSTTIWTNPLTHQSYAILGTTEPNVLNAINLSTHRLAWTLTVPGITLTGMGDSTPTYSRTANMLIESESVRMESGSNGQTSNFGVYGINPQTGTVVWQDSLGRGPVPAAYRGAVSTSHNGVIYVSDTATSTLFAINAKTGAVLWHSTIPNVLSAGAGRGAPTYADGIIWIATAQNINAFNARTGDLLSSYHVGGRFGIVNPVIAGGTMYIDNSYDWIMAIPLKKIVPQIRL